MTLKDCYEKLGIEKTFDIKTIKKAYKEKAKHLHPDVNHSNNSHLSFIELTEAYERLLLFIDFRQKHGETIGKIIIDEEKNAEAELWSRIEKARQMKQQKKDNENKLILSIYKNYVGSWKIYFSGILTIISILLAAFLFIDYIGVGNTILLKVVSTSIENRDMVYEDSYITFNNGKEVAVDAGLCMRCKQNDVLIVEQTKYFGEITKISERLNEQTIEHYPLSFFNDAWILFIILLILPIFSFIFMKPNFIFAFLFVHYNVYIHPLIIFYILGGNARIFNLISMFIQ